MDRGWLLAGIGGHYPARRFHLGVGYLLIHHDRHDGHPQLAHASVDGGRLAAEDQGS